MNRLKVLDRDRDGVFKKAFHYLNTCGTVRAMSAKVSAKPVPVAILLRVSADKQETARQENELRAVAKARGWQVAEVCEETTTGRADIGGASRIASRGGAGCRRQHSQAAGA